MTIEDAAQRELQKIRALCVEEGRMNDEGTTFDLVRAVLYAAKRFQQQRDELALKLHQQNAAGR